MQKLKLSQIARALGAEILYEADICEIVTDSRKANAGTLFVAICGENLDGNQFAASALQNGAEAVVVSALFEGVDPKRAIVVPDTKRALISLGGLYRRLFDIPFVGVTGSVGKTTTKEFIHAVLSTKYRTHKNAGNQNNEIGVPNTLFALESAHEAAVIEMGMSGFGEIRDLTTEIRPSVGVITTIGVSHIEQLGSRENILKAKLELLEGMPDGAPLFLCGDNEYLSTVQAPRLTVYRYGVTNQACEIRASEIAQKDASTRFIITSPWGEHSAVIPVVGQHNVLDALAAFGVGCVMGLEPDQAAAALANYLPVGMRQNVVPFKGMVVVEDCYNCSPDSLKAAALALSSYPCKGRRILVLSDMLELGPNAPAMHAECGAFIARQDINLLMACGSLSEHTVNGADKAGMERCCHYDSKDRLAQELIKAVRPGDVIWFKASRGMRMEDVIQQLYGKGENA
ncbi:MAG TPA: UDP-N-acetylmuramoyl-tripeptide--D-alanyl-D-alanine ligase [Clostridia bacterium]|nr:UDP-N-acetylmuramoyl-tripeptide--D-alanyl-D-alanine ligase [Clostridia bacterium]